jgi:hypothetical protein
LSWHAFYCDTAAMMRHSDVLGRIGLSVPIQTEGAAESVDGLDAAVQAVLDRRRGHTIITSDGQTSIHQVLSFGSALTMPAAPVATIQSPDVVAVIVNGGERVYVSSDPAASSTRWVDVPDLFGFYRLPAADREQMRNRWADRLAQKVPDIDQASARALPIPLLRTMLAHHAEAVLPVTTVRRGEPPVETGGVVNGLTLPIPQLPVREPDCYVSVIAQAEGRLESINAWDINAGISLGVIQFNADRAALFRFLWQLWTEDPELFAAELTQPLGWSMAWDGDHADLVVGEARLHGRGADKARNAAFLQTGKLNGTGLDPGYRRKVAAGVRNCVAWPHVQAMVMDTSSWWLQPALDRVRAEGIGPLDPQAPDHDTFVLTALLLSGGVRYSSCLQRLLVALRPWPSVSEKLQHWKTALATTTDPCPSLLKRLKNQQPHAERVYDQIGRQLA